MPVHWTFDDGVGGAGGGVGTGGVGGGGAGVGDTGALHLASHAASVSKSPFTPEDKASQW